MKNNEKIIETNVICIICKKAKNLTGILRSIWIMDNLKWYENLKGRDKVWNNSINGLNEYI